jgi:hypothetical protein
MTGMVEATTEARGNRERHLLASEIACEGFSTDALEDGDLAWALGEAAHLIHELDRTLGATGVTAAELGHRETLRAALLRLRRKA